MTHQFAWTNIYQELATTLLVWENKQSELIAFLDDLHTGLHRQLRAR